MPMSSYERNCHCSLVNSITVINKLGGYWQAHLDKGAKKCTVFITHKGQYSWKVMHYGLKKSAAPFQCIMNQLLQRHRKYACSYIDNVAVHSNTWEDHMV